MNFSSNLADDNFYDYSSFGVLPIVVFFGLSVLHFAGLWLMFKKANHSGVLAIVPIVNIYFLLKIAGFSPWLIFLYLVPLANILLHLLVSLNVAKCFSKSNLFGVVCLWIFPVVGYPVLGFGNSEYKSI